MKILERLRIYIMYLVFEVGCHLIYTYEDTVRKNKLRKDLYIERLRTLGRLENEMVSHF